MKFVNEENEILIDRNSLKKHYVLSKSKLHRILKDYKPYEKYKGMYLYKYDDVIEKINDDDNLYNGVFE